ncbi:MAG: DUF1501 domain-containing protein [Gemmataceae bacterium]
MLRLTGSPRTLCDGLTRRDFLVLGTLGTGLSLAQAAQAQSTERARADACIFLFPYGSPPQHETFDPKPDAPPEVRGEMGSIPTALPGVRIGEGLPRVARILDKVTVVRSMSHPYPVHGVVYAVSGIPTYTPDLETRHRDSRLWPFVGSAVDYVLAKRTGQGLPEVPRNIVLPWVLNSKTDLDVKAGPYAAYLGQAYDPIFTDFDGVGTKIAPRYTADQGKEFLDPFAQTVASGRFHVSTEARLRADVPGRRLDLRRDLLQRFDRARAGVDRAGNASIFDRFQQQAFSLISSSRMREALDVGREPHLLRERYGMTLFGQACLAARRLVEAGCKFVTVFWDGYGQFANCAWDTHANHFPRLRDYLLPGFDLAYSALIEDLDTRGMLDRTLVVCTSEHGRTPQIDSKPKGAGRHHWSRVYSAVLAGGGVARGRVVGSSDKLGGEVKDTPISAKDLLATMVDALGIDPETTLPDQQARPMPIVGAGTARREVLA